MAEKNHNKKVYKKSVAHERKICIYPPAKQKEFIEGQSAIKGVSKASIVTDIIKKHLEGLPPTEVDRVRKAAPSKNSY